MRRLHATTRAPLTRVAIGVSLLLTPDARADIESTPLGQAPTGTSPVPTSTPEPFALGGYLQTVLALALVLGLIVLVATLFKKFAASRPGLMAGLGTGGPSPSGVLEILGRYPLGGGQTLVLLRFDRRVVLAHQVGGRRNASMRTLSEVTDPDEVASIMMKTRAPADERAESSFREAIRRMEEGFDDPRPASGSAPRVAAPDSSQQQIDLLVGEPGGRREASAIRGMLRNWVGAS
jgi:flagellar biogenesis protein FliO